MKRLVPESPLLVLPGLAAEIGINEAVVLQQLHYWTSHKGGGGEDTGVEVWVHNTYTEWQKQFPWLSKRTVQRVLDRLEKLGMVEIKQDGGTDRTHCYRLLYGMVPELPGSHVAKLATSKEPDWPLAKGQGGHMSNNKQQISTKENVIFDFWVKTMNKGPTTKFNPKRRRLVKARLAEGRDVAYIELAILNCSRDPWHMKSGEHIKRDGPVHNDLTLICRDDCKLEEFHDMASSEPPSDHGRFWGDE
jgi:hypothetical protein